MTAGYDDVAAADDLALPRRDTDGIHRGGERERERAQIHNKKMSRASSATLSCRDVYTHTCYISVSNLSGGHLIFPRGRAVRLDTRDVNGRHVNFMSLYSNIEILEILFDVNINKKSHLRWIDF